MKPIDLAKIRKILRSANFKLTMKEYWGALQEYQYAFTLLPDSVELSNIIAELQLLLGNFDAGIQQYSESIVLSPAPEQQIRLGFAHLRASNFILAKQVFSKITSVEATDFLLLGRAICDYHLRDNYAEILQSIEGIDLPLAQMLRARLYAKIGEYSQAIVLLKQMPDTWEVLHLLGIFYMHVGQYSSAHSCFKSALWHAREVNVNVVILDKLTYDYNATNPDSWERYKFLITQPTTFETLYGLAVSVYEQEGFSDAFHELLQEALALNPDAPDYMKQWLGGVIR